MRVKEREKPMPKLIQAMGTVLFFVASIKVIDKTFLSLPRMKSFAQHSIKRLGLGLRRIVVEHYPGPCNAYTLIAFLNESHFALTTYPEDSIVELELASCKQLELHQFVSWLYSRDEHDVHSVFLLDKDQQGKWARSI